MAYQQEQYFVRWPFRPHHPFLHYPTSTSCQTNIWARDRCAAAVAGVNMADEACAERWFRLHVLRRKKDEHFGDNLCTVDSRGELMSIREVRRLITGDCSKLQLLCRVKSSTTMAVQRSGNVGKPTAKVYLQVLGSATEDTTPSLFLFADSQRYEPRGDQWTTLGQPDVETSRTQAQPSLRRIFL